MFAVAIFLLVIAAISGAIMSAYIFVGSMHPPVGLAVAHGCAAVTAVALALASVITRGAPAALTAALAVLVLALLGGLYLFSFHLRGKPHPKPVIALHALLALGGFVALVLVMVQAPGAW